MNVEFAYGFISDSYIWFDILVCPKFQHESARSDIVEQTLCCAYDTPKPYGMFIRQLGSWFFNFRHSRATYSSEIALLRVFKAGGKWHIWMLMRKVSWTLRAPYAIWQRFAEPQQYLMRWHSVGFMIMIVLWPLRFWWHTVTDGNRMQWMCKHL